MATEVELGNFLTRMYLEKTSATGFMGSSYKQLRFSILLADHTLLYELLNVIGHLGPKYSVPCPKEAVLFAVVAFVYVSQSQFRCVQVRVIFLNNWVYKPSVFASKQVTSFKTVSRCITRVVLVCHQCCIVSL